LIGNSWKLSLLERLKFAQKERKLYGKLKETLQNKSYEKLV